VRLGLVCRPFSFHGGVETATAGLLAALASHGHAVDLISTRAQEDVPGVRVRRLPVVRQPSLARLVSFALLARRAVRSSAYDLVQSHERTLLQDVYRAGEGSHRGYLDAMGRGEDRVGSYHRMVKYLERRAFQLDGTRHIVAIAAQGRDEIMRLFGTPPEAVSVVYNGVDLARFHPDGRARWRDETRAALGVPAEAWLVLFVGSGFARKGLDTLIEALGALKDAWLVVAGKGDTAPHARAAERLGIAERVRWLGPRPDVERLYAAADAVALPARYEPFGNVHLEALAAGVPVVTSRRAGGAEVIEDGRNGWVVPPADPPALTAALARLRDADPRALAEAARRSAEPFTHAAWVERLTGLYRRLAPGA